MPTSVSYAAINDDHDHVHASNDTHTLHQQSALYFDGSPAHKSSDSAESLPTNNTNNTTTSAAFDSSDILDLPLPAIPTAKRRTVHAVNASANSAAAADATTDPDNPPVPIGRKEFSSLPHSYKSAAHHRRHSHNNASLNDGQHQRLTANDASNAQSVPSDPYASDSAATGAMHYHSSHEKPRYLFGERVAAVAGHHHSGSAAAAHHAPQLGAAGHSAAVQLSSDDDKVYWNHSGWMQVSHQQRSFEKSPHRSGIMVMPPAMDRRRVSGGSSGVGGLGGVARFSAASFDSHHSGHSDYNMPPPQQQSVHDGRARSNALRAELNAQHTRNSKIEELISRSEARRSTGAAVPPKKLLHQHSHQRQPHQSIYSIDPQISAILNERPGFLPVKRLLDNESPPPVTPIISPPPAFQDTQQAINAKPPNSTGNSPSQFHLTVSNADAGRQRQQTASTAATAAVTPSAQHYPGKGMVFSRSFEYDNRKNRDYMDSFSKSFDYDLVATSAAAVAAAQASEAASAQTPDRLRSKMFNNLTGVSPNYLTKKESNRSRNSSRDASPVFQQQQQLQPIAIVEPFKPKTRVRSTLSVRPERYMSLDEQQQQLHQQLPSHQQGRSRRAQFSNVHESSSSTSSQGFRSLDQSVTKTVNLRLNSCDSGARSGL